MQAVILAAGEGKRLRPLTETTPKPMVRINGRPILEYTLSALPESVNEAIIIVGYKGEQVVNHFGNTFGKLKLTFVTQKELKGTGDALKSTKDLLRDEHFLVLVGDDLYRPDDIKKCTEYPLSILAKETEHPERYGVCVADENDNLKEVVEKPACPVSNLVGIGVYVLNKKVFDMPEALLPNGEANLVAQINSLAQIEPMRIVKARFWHPIGYPEDLKKAEYFAKITPEKWEN